MVYYFHAVAQVGADVERGAEVVFCTPSGNFGNLTAGPDGEARRVCRSSRFVAATNVNDVVPGVSRDRRVRAARVGPRRSPTRWTSGNPSNFERMRWLYGDDLDAMRRDVAGSRSRDDEVRDDDQAGLRASAATCSIRTARSPTLGSKASGGRQARAGGTARHLSRDGASGEVRGDRRADHRARGREAGAARAGARAAAAHHPDRSVARRGQRCARCLTAGRVPLSLGCARSICSTRRAADASHAAAARARLRPRSLQVRDPHAARALRAAGVSEARILGARRRAAPPVSGAGAAGDEFVYTPNS